MARALTTQQLGILAVVVTGDVVAPWSHQVLNELEQMRLVATHHLKQPNGRLAISKRWTITDAGRAVIAQASR